MYNLAKTLRTAAVNADQPSDIGRIKQIVLLIGKNRAAVFALFVVLTLAAFTDAVGAALILPLMQILVGEKVDGGFGELLRPILFSFGEQWALHITLFIFITSIILKEVFHLLKIWFEAWVGVTLVHDWRNRIFSYLLSQDFVAFTKKNQGEHLDNLYNRPTHGTALIHASIEIVSTLFLQIFLLIVLLKTSLDLTIGMVILGAIAMALSYSTIRKHSLYFGKSKVDLQQSILSDNAQCIAGMQEIRILQVEDKVSEKLKNDHDSLRKVHSRFMVFQRLPLMAGELLVGSAVVALIYYQSWVLGKPLQQILPELVLFIFVGKRIITSLSQVMSHRIKALAALPATRSVVEILNQEQFIKNSLSSASTVSKENIQSIHLHNVTFAYPNKEPVFNEFNCVFKRGNIYVLKGDSGSGKTTLVQLITGFYPVQSGELKVNDRSVDSAQLVALRGKISYVSQSPFIFYNSIRENLLIAKPDATDDDLRSALKKAAAWDFVDALPHGFDTLIGNKNMELSGGQLQRISLARAFLRQSDLYILDEATNAIDASALTTVRASIKEVACNSIFIMITHDVGLMDDANHVVNIIGNR